MTRGAGALAGWAGATGWLTGCGLGGAGAGRSGLDVVAACSPCAAIDVHMRHAPHPIQGPTVTTIASAMHPIPAVTSVLDPSHPDDRGGWGGGG